MYEFASTNAAFCSIGGPASQLVLSCNKEPADKKYLQTQKLSFLYVPSDDKLVVSATAIGTYSKNDPDVAGTSTNMEYQQVLSISLGLANYYYWDQDSNTPCADSSAGIESVSIIGTGDAGTFINQLNSGFIDSQFYDTYYSPVHNG